MFEAGQYIMYTTQGVCQVRDVGHLTTPGADPQRLYYTLENCFSSGTTYVPVDTTLAMRPIMSREEAETLLSSLHDLQDPEDVTRDVKAAQAEYKAALAAQDAKSLLTLIRRIHHKNEASRKPYSQLDERYFRMARDMLHGELAIALNIPLEDVEAVIENAVKPEA